MSVTSIYKICALERESNLDKSLFERYYNLLYCVTVPPLPQKHRFANTERVPNVHNSCFHGANSVQQVGKDVMHKPIGRI